jgi:predicted NBD/HSP70 family sugar kinase
MSRPLVACVEVGGSSTQTVVFDRDTVVLLDGAHQPPGSHLALAVPGLLDGHRVVNASNLGWLDVDPVEILGLTGPAIVVRNDAEAAALGEVELRGHDGDLAYVGMGTGIGGAVMGTDGAVVSNLFGHDHGFGELECRCGRRGCLETVAAGWAVPAELTEADLPAIANAVAHAVDREPAAHRAGLVVVSGGMARRYPALVGLVANALPGRDVEPSAAPRGAKSAAPWGLRRLVERTQAAVTERGRS